jgi:hypothetical protein
MLRRSRSSPASRFARFALEDPAAIAPWRDVGSNLNGTAVADTFSDARSAISSENKTHALDFIRGALHQEPVVVDRD